MCVILYHSSTGVKGNACLKPDLVKVPLFNSFFERIFQNAIIKYHVMITKYFVVQILIMVTAIAVACNASIIIRPPGKFLLLTFISEKALSIITAGLKIWITNRCRTGLRRSIILLTACSIEFQEEIPFLMNLTNMMRWLQPRYPASSERPALFL